MLSNNEIKRQIKLNNIKITDLDKNALEKPNSCTLHLGDELFFYDYQIFDPSSNYDYINEIRTGNLKKLRKITISKNGVLLEPHKVYLTKTKEHIKTKNYIPTLHGKVSNSLLGMAIELTNSYKTENYNDYLYPNIVTTKPTIIYPYMEIGNLTFDISENKKNKEIGMLSGEEIKKRLNKDIIITPQDNIVINPNSVNLTLHDVIGYYSDPIIDLKKKNKIEYLKIGENGIILYPDTVYVAKTNEWTETYNLVPMLSGRSSLGRLGFRAHCSAGMGSIGFKGNWHLGIRVAMPLEIKKDMKCCQIYYNKVEGDITNTYEGSMQNLPSTDIESKNYTRIRK